MFKAILRLIRRGNSIFDVSTYKYPPVWVKAEDLWAAMNTIDSSAAQKRGLVTIATLDEEARISNSSAKPLIFPEKLYI